MAKREARENILQSSWISPSFFGFPADVGDFFAPSPSFPFRVSFGYTAKEEGEISLQSGANRQRKGGRGGKANGGRPTDRGIISLSLFLSLPFLVFSSQKVTRERREGRRRRRRREMIWRTIPSSQVILRSSPLSYLRSCHLLSSPRLSGKCRYFLLSVLTKKCREIVKHILSCAHLCTQSRVANKKASLLCAAITAASTSAGFSVDGSRLLMLMARRKEDKAKTHRGRRD